MHAAAAKPRHQRCWRVRDRIGFLTAATQSVGIMRGASEQRFKFGVSAHIRESLSPASLSMPLLVPALNDALVLLDAGGNFAVATGVERVRARMLKWHRAQSAALDAPQSDQVLPVLNDAARSASLGLFAPLPDNIILDILERLQSQELRKLMQVSGTLHVFACTESLWANITLAEHKDAALLFHSGIWRATHAALKSRSATAIATASLESQPSPQPAPVFIARPAFHSPLLYGKWCREHLALHDFECSWNHIDVSESSALDAAAFTALYDDRSRPVLLRCGAAQWQGFKRYGPDSGPGGMHRFCSDHADLRMRLSHSFHAAGSLRCKLSDYSRYCLWQHDEVPLYVFDAKFVTTHEPLRSLYDIPAQFQHDIFSHLGSIRPSYRWIVMGPARCGAPWHVDPIGTSAWNGLVCGRKRWAMYPPGHVPPGVIVYNGDIYGGVRSPPSASWYCEIYPKLLPHERPLEIMQRPGDIIYVPAGWWHLVLNLDDTLAFTQNYVSPSNFPLALSEMRGQSSQLYYMFSVAVPRVLLRSFPGLLQANASAELLSQKLKLPQGDPPHCTAAAFIQHLDSKFSIDSSLKQIRHFAHAHVHVISALVDSKSHQQQPLRSLSCSSDTALDPETMLPLLLVSNSLNPMCERMKKLISPRITDSPNARSWRTIVSGLINALGCGTQSMTCPAAGESAVWLTRDCVFKIVTIPCAQPLHYALAEAAALRLLYCDERHPDSVANEVAALCSAFDDDHAASCHFDARLCIVDRNPDHPSVMCRAAYPALLGTGALAINNAALGGNWDPRSSQCISSAQVAVRPTLDDGSSSDSCNSSSSGSGSDDDAVTSGDSTCSAQEQAHHFNGNDGSTNSDPSCALPSPNPSELKQAAATPHQWFWSAFISVQRLPGVALRRISKGAPKHRRREGSDDSCIAARFLACDGLEQARRLAILAVPFAHVLADVHRRKVQGSNAWVNWDWFVKWQHDKAQANIAYSTVASDALIQALPEWLPPHDWIGWRCGDRLPSLLHGDATCDNCMVTWQHSALAAGAAASLAPSTQATAACAPLVSLIDFADCRIGPALYDFVAAWLSGLSCSPTAIKAFRSAYAEATGYDPLSEAFSFSSRQPFCTSKGVQRCIRSEADMFICFCILHVGARGALTALEASGCAAVGQGRSWDEIVAFVTLLLA